MLILEAVVADLAVIVTDYSSHSTTPACVAALIAANDVYAAAAAAAADAATAVAAAAAIWLFFLATFNLRISWKTPSIASATCVIIRVSSSLCGAKLLVTWRCRKLANSLAHHIYWQLSVKYASHTKMKITSTYQADDTHTPHACNCLLISKWVYLAWVCVHHRVAKTTNVSFPWCPVLILRFQMFSPNTSVYHPFFGFFMCFFRLSLFLLLDEFDASASLVICFDDFVMVWPIQRHFFVLDLMVGRFYFWCLPQYFIADCFKPNVFFPLLWNVFLFFLRFIQWSFVANNLAVVYEWGKCLIRTSTFPFPHYSREYVVLDCQCVE